MLVATKALKEEIRREFAKRAGSRMMEYYHRELCLMHLGFIIHDWPPMAIVLAGEEDV